MNTFDPLSEYTPAAQAAALDRLLEDLDRLPSPPPEPEPEEPERWDGLS